jgi:hypothetical protein
MAKPTDENDVPVFAVTAYVGDDGKGWFYACPRCHFYKNTKPGPCRRIGCGGTVERTDFRVTSPAEKGQADA